MAALSRRGLRRTFWLLTFGVIALAGSTAPEQQESAMVAATQVFTPSPTYQPTGTTFVTPTSTITPTPTPPPPTAIPTVQPVPTLSVLEEGALLSELMADNGGCELPCWWGISPGQTAAQAAKSMFASQGIGRWDASFDGSYSVISLGHPYADSPYYSSDVSLKLWMEGELVQFIDVEGRRRSGEDSFLFDQDWSQYNLAGILGSLGKPAYAALFAEIPADSGPHYYQLRLSYPSLGIEIWYLIAPLPLSNGGE